MPRNAYALTFVLAEQLTAAPGELQGVQPLLFEATGPIGNQGAVRRTGDRVFGNAGIRRQDCLRIPFL